MLELEAKTLARGHGEPSARLQEVNLKRAEVLLQLGRSTAAVTLLMQLPASLRRAELLERSGRSHRGHRGLSRRRRKRPRAAAGAQSPTRRGGWRRSTSTPDAQYWRGRSSPAWGWYATPPRPEAAQDWWQAAYRWETVQEPARAAEAYRKAGKTTDAARCFVTAGQPLQAARLLHPLRGPGDGGRPPRPDRGPRRRHRPLSRRQRRGPGRHDPAEDPRRRLRLRHRRPAAGARLVEAGRSGEALRFLGKAPAADPRRRGEDGTVLDRLYWEGRALEGLAQREPARKRYAKLLQLNPTYRDVAERIEPAGRPAGAGAGDHGSTLQARSLDGLAVGQRLANRYDILGETGRGGMGRVYRARDLDLGEPVAIKTLLTPAEGVAAAGDDEERLLREKLQICTVSHPNVVRVFDLGRFEGGIFITMELLEGQMLEELIVKDQPIALERIRFFLSEIAAGLQEAHSLGIVHRDLKPSNVMVTGRRLKILDFGIARMTGFDNRLTRTGFAFGSPMYMSPEQLLGQPLDGRSDLYALGILGYALIAGREPFADDNPAVLALMHLRDKVPDIRQFRSDLPNPLDRLHRPAAGQGARPPLRLRRGGPRRPAGASDRVSRHRTGRARKCTHGTRALNGPALHWSLFSGGDEMRAVFPKSMPKLMAGGLLLAGLAVPAVLAFPQYGQTQTPPGSCSHAVPREAEKQAGATEAKPAAEAPHPNKMRDLIKGRENEPAETVFKNIQTLEGSPPAASWMPWMASTASAPTARSATTRRTSRPTTRRRRRSRGKWCG